MNIATYWMPARSLGMGAIVRRRTPAGANIDHVIDRIELRAGDEVRLDLVDPATGWGAFLVLDGNAEVEVVIPAADVDDDVVEAEILDDDTFESNGLHPEDFLAAPDADPRELCNESTIAGPCARYADHDGPHYARIGDGS